MMKSKTNTMIKYSDFPNWIKRYISIDFVIIFFVLWVLTCLFRHGNYNDVTEFLQDIRLRNAILLFFYYSVSRLSFHFLKTESYVITLIVLLSVSLRESYVGIIQLFQGAPYPVGTMLNPNIFACLLSIACSILVVLIIKLKSRLLKVLLYIIVSIFAVLMSFSKSRLALLSVIVPVLWFLSLNPRFSGFIRKHVISISIVLMALFAILYFLKKPSADGRLYMAKIATRIMTHNGLWGTGADTYAGAFGDEQFRYFSDYCDKADINTLISLDKRDSKYACTPLTAFNEFLRIGVEYGLITMLLALFIFVQGMVLLIRNDNPLGYGLLSLFVISHFSYPHCYPIYCLLFSIFIGAAGSLDNRETKSGFNCFPWITNAVEMLLFGILLFLELPQIENRKTLEKKERDIAFFFRNEEYSTVCDYCDGLGDIQLFSLDLLYEYGVSLSITGQYEKSDSVLRLGVSRCSTPTFWHEIGHNYVRSGNFEDAEQSYIRSFLTVPNRMTPLFYLAQLYHNTGDNEKLERLASFSDTFKPKVPSYTTQQYHDKIMQMAYGE